jgi:hypothetical protein
MSAECGALWARQHGTQCALGLSGGGHPGAFDGEKRGKLRVSRELSARERRQLARGRNVRQPCRRLMLLDREACQ